MLYDCRSGTSCSGHAACFASLRVQFCNSLASKAASDTCENLNCILQTCLGYIAPVEFVQAFFAPNAWPAHFPELRTSLEHVYTGCTKLSAALLRVFAVALHQDEHFFDDKIDRHASNLQVANYSSLGVPPDGGVTRKKSHLDSGTFTILASDDWSRGTWQVS
jgi:isopenicillin N synthase-like dioxygenase